MLSRSLLSLLFLAALAGQVSAAEFDPQLLTTGQARVRAIRAADLTGDGVCEIVAFGDGPAGIEIDVFAPDQGGTYPSEPSLIFRPADRGHFGVYYAALHREQGEGPAEILLVDRRRGVTSTGVVQLEAGPALTETRTLAPAPPLPFPPDEERMTVLDVSVDLDGDGAEELVLPATNGYRILSPGREKVEVATLAIPPRLAAAGAAHRFSDLTWDLPRLTAADWDADGLLDLVGGLDGRLYLFLQTRDGSFYEVGSRLDLLEAPPEGGERSDPVLGDVNGDGRIDLVVSSHPTRIDPLKRFTSRQALYLNPRILAPTEEGRLSTPAGSFVVDGVGVNPTLLDFDGDGALDLLVTALDATPGDRLRKEIDAEYGVYRFDAETGRFEEDPFFELTRPFPVAQLERGVTAPVCFFSGDFDGDGKRDLLDIADAGHLSIYAGTTDTGFLSTARYGFQDEPIFTAKVEVENPVLITRLGGRGADDVVAWRGGRIYVIRRSR